MTTRTRAQIIEDWSAVINGPGLVASGAPEDEAFTVAALAASYDAITGEFYETTGELPYWALISQEERDAAAKSGAAMPDGSYPITTCDGENSVDTAVNAVGRGNADHDAIRRHIIKRADSLGCTSKIPDNWNGDGSLKATEAAATEGTAFALPPPPPPHGGPPATDPAAPPAKAPPAPPKAPPAPGKPDGATEADATVSEAVKAAQTAVDNAVAAQKADPDNVTDPKDAKVLAGLEQAAAILGQVEKDQAADADETTSGKGAPTPAAPGAGPTPAEGETGAKPTPKPGMTAAGAGPGLEPGNADGVPGDADDSPPGPGDIEAEVQCDNPNCGHTGALHQDTDEGANRGACTTPGCECPGMVPTADQVNGPDDTQGGPDNAGGDDDGATAPAKMTLHEAVALAKANLAGGPPPPGAAGDGPTEPQAPPVSGAPAPVLPPLDAIPDTVGPAFTMPVAALENVPTGDGRIVQPEALTWRVPPLPLMGLKTSPHDPSGMSPNAPAVLIGRIESFERAGNIISGKGHLLTTEEGLDFTDILSQMGRMGVSIDVGAAEIQVTADPSVPTTPDVFDQPLIESLTKGEIMGATVCPFAAFAGAYIVLGDDPTAGSGAEMPAAPAESKMAIRYVDTEECEPCQEAAAALVASDAPGTAGPIAPPSEWFADPGFTVGDPRLRETLDLRGRPSGKFACPMTITEDGRVFGHIAQWGVCHQSAKFLNNGQCIMAPRSKTGYALFHNGSVLTAEGEVLSVGKLTADAGHAATEGLTDGQVLAHYDNSALTGAVVRAGEDDFGIWVAGSVHPSASPEQVFTLRANPPSGDWRPYGAGNELRAVLHVNSPGFQIVQATMKDGRITSLVAAGVPMFDVPETLRAPLTDAERLAALEQGFAAIGPLAKAHLVGQMETVRAG